MSNHPTHCSSMKAGDISNPLRTLIEFEQGCSPDPHTRCLAMATLVIMLWQDAGRAMSQEPPWLLFVNTGSGADPLYELARSHTGLGLLEPDESRGNHFAGNPASAITTLRSLALDRHDMERQNPLGIGKFMRDTAQLRRMAMAALCGFGRAGRYELMYREPLGWLGDSTDDGILLLDTSRGLELFRIDVLDNPERLLKPTGLGAQLKMVPKVLGVTGSLLPAQWDDAIVAAIVSKGMPALFMPHAATEPLHVKDRLALELISCQFASEWPVKTNQQVFPRNNLPKSPWLASCEQRLRRRLHHFPGNYEFFILRTLRELSGVCANIAAFVAARGMNPPNEQQCLYTDLYLASVWAIVKGVESLAWHGWGFDAGCPREEVVELLDFMRGEDGQVSRRDLQRKVQCMNAAKRDEVLECLEAEGLVRTEGKMVEAVGLAEFVRSLPSRAGLELPVLWGPELIEIWKKTP